MSRQENENNVKNQSQSQILAGSDPIIALLTSQGLLGDGNIDDEKKRAAMQEKQRNCYHNTLMLLKHYRDIAWTIECFPEAVAEELDVPFRQTDELLSCVDTEIAMGNRRLENWMSGMQKSRLLLDRVNDALTVLKKKPEDGERLYQLIYLTYIEPEKLNLTEILYRMDMSPRHYYRLRGQAVKILSIRLWSAPAKEVDYWLEILTLLEGIA